MFIQIPTEHSVSRQWIALLPMSHKKDARLIWVKVNRSPQVYTMNTEGVNLSSDSAVVLYP